jgi:hypothetical protein
LDLDLEFLIILNMCVVKVIEVIGTSPKSFQDALQEVLRRTAKTVENITGMDVIAQNVVVEKNKIVEYRVVVKVAFVVK